MFCAQFVVHIDYISVMVNSVNTCILYVRCLQNRPTTRFSVEIVFAYISPLVCSPAELAGPVIYTNVDLVLLLQYSFCGTGLICVYCICNKSLKILPDSLCIV